ncbi:hypothetical protein NQ318_003613 [Aromia moschata]|uniref:General transcription factor 3C polypeptide 5 n=1 Tax=Aromia moschata TaxID=1265417 RepID=A0AAV8Y2S3_9CUCU|nr:hypothetical protein NQ318_003613 [Aromia moschata]
MFIFVTAVADHRNKLELHFHPDNKFNKPCVADRDLNPGVLIRVRSTPEEQNNLEKGANGQCHYDIIGITTLNFKFNRICDFQYLPLISTNTDNDSSEVEYIYDQILPESIPTVNWFLPKVLIPDSCQRWAFALYVEGGFFLLSAPSAIKIIFQPDCREMSHEWAVSRNQPYYPSQLVSTQSFMTLLAVRSKEGCEQRKFCIPPNFARFDSSQNKLYLNAGEKFGSNVRPEITKLIESNKPQKKSNRISTKQVSIFVNFQTPNVQIPDQPLSYTMELVKERNLEQMYKTVKKLFEERPVWTKVAIQYKTGLKSDHAKIILPAVAYFCPIGPWRMTWVRYEYNPQKDFNARIYQTLDYRIRATEGTKIKVNAKRSYTSKTLFYIAPNNIKKVSLKDDIISSKKDVIEERSHVLRPNVIPPARQMFYQYCDILIPEIQEMVLRLPKLPAGSKCDPKNGWLPTNFTEQCREIVNKCVMDRVQEELLEDAIKLQQSVQPEKEPEKESGKESPTYCSQMLNNIKRGIYKSVNVIPSTEPKASNYTSSPIHIIDSIEDIDEELEQVNADDVVNSIPERMDENSDDEHLSQSSDLDIDMEAVEEVNKMVAGLQEDEEVNAVASYLKNKI